MDKTTLLKIGAWSAAGLGAAAGIVWVGAPFAAKWALSGPVSEMIGRKVSAESVSINPLALSVTVKGLTVAAANPDSQPDLTVGLVSADIGAKTLFGQSAVIEQIRVDGLQASVSRSKDGVWSFQDILDRLSASGADKDGAKEAGKNESKDYPVTVSDVALTNIGATYRDEAAGAGLEISGLQFDLPEFTTDSQRAADPITAKTSLKLNGTAVSAEFSGAPFAGDKPLSASLRIEPLDVARLVPLAPVKLKGAVKSLKLSADLAVRLEKGLSAPLDTTLKGSVEAQGLDVADADGQTLASLDGAKVQIAGINAARHSAEIDTIAIDKPFAQVTIAKGLDSFSRLMGAEPPAEPPAPQPAEKPDQAPAQDAAPAASKTAENQSQKPVEAATQAPAADKPAAPAEPPAPTWHARLGSLAITAPAFKFSNADTGIQASFKQDKLLLKDVETTNKTESDPYGAMIGRFELSNSVVGFADPDQNASASMGSFVLEKTGASLGGKSLPLAWAKLGSLAVSEMTAAYESKKLSAKALANMKSVTVTGIDGSENGSEPFALKTGTIALEGTDAVWDDPANKATAQIEALRIGGLSAAAASGQQVPLSAFTLAQLEFSKLAARWNGPQARQVQATIDRLGLANVANTNKAGEPLSLQVGDLGGDGFNATYRDARFDAKAGIAGIHMGVRELSVKGPKSVLSLDAGPLEVSGTQAHLKGITAKDPLDLDYNGGTFKIESARSDSSEADPFGVAVTGVDLRDVSAIYTDKRLADKVSVTGLKAAIASVSTAKARASKPIELAASFQFNGAPVSISGQASPFLPTLPAKVDLTLDNFSLPAALKLNPKPFKGKLASGTLTAKLGLEHEANPSGGFQKLSASGFVDVTGLKFLDAKGASLLDLPKMSLKAPHIDLPSHRIDIESLDIVRPQISLVQGKNGNNWTEALSSGAGKGAAKEEPASSAAADTAASAPAAGSDSKPWSVRLNSLIVEDNTFRFSDTSLKKPMKLALTKNNIIVTGLETGSSTPADIKANAKIDDSNMQTRGTVTLPALGGDVLRGTSGNIRIRIDRMPMTVFTPYALEYLDEPITKGTLEIDSKYALNNAKLHADNDVAIHKLEFGPAGKNASGLSTAAPLAVAILRDSNGVVRLNVPIDGDITSPDFSYGGLVLKALFNVITSPIQFMSKVTGISSVLNKITGDTGKAKDVQLDPNLVAKARALQQLKGLKIKGTSSKSTKKK